MPGKWRTSFTKTTTQGCVRNKNRRPAVSRAVAGTPGADHLYRLTSSPCFRATEILGREPASPLFASRDGWRKGEICFG